MSTKPASKKRSAEDSAAKTAGKIAKAATTEAKKSPLKIFEEKLNEFIKDNGFQGAMPVRGYKRNPRPKEEDDDDDYDEEEDEEEAGRYEPTEEEMSAARFIMMDKKRVEAEKEMASLVLGDQAEEEGFLMFDTSYSYQVFGGFYQELKRSYNNRKTKLPDKFNLLLGFTYNIKQHDVWMHDNEGGMEKMVKDLAAMWKKLLKNTDEALGIDSEYTRPGIIALLEDFKEEIESVDNYEMPPFKFKFM